MRTLSILIVAAGLVALSLTAASGPNQETLPTVPPTTTVSSIGENTESEVVEMRNWHSTASTPTVKKRP